MDEALAKLQPGLTGIRIDSSVSRPADFIDESRDSLTTALIAGAVLLLVFLGAVLFDWRAGVITVVGVSISCHRTKRGPAATARGQSGR